MTSNELVRQNRVPLWDAEVERIFTDIVAAFRDDDLDPATKRGVLISKAGKLERLVDQMESGTWPEGVLGPVPDAVPASDETVKIGHNILDLTDAEVWDRLQAMTYAEKVEWFRTTE